MVSLARNSVGDPGLYESVEGRVALARFKPSDVVTWTYESVITGIGPKRKFVNMALEMPTVLGERLGWRVIV